MTLTVTVSAFAAAWFNKPPSSVRISMFCVFDKCSANAI